MQCRYYRICGLKAVTHIFINIYVILQVLFPPHLDFSKQVKQKVTSTSLSVHGLAEAVTYTFRVRAETFDYGPESVGNITTGPQEGNTFLLSSPQIFHLFIK